MKNAGRQLLSFSDECLPKPAFRFVLLYIYPFPILLLYHNTPKNASISPIFILFLLGPTNAHKWLYIAIFGSGRVIFHLIFTVICFVMFTIHSQMSSITHCINCSLFSAYYTNNAVCICAYIQT